MRRAAALAARFFAVTVNAGCAYAAPLIVAEHVSVRVTGAAAAYFASTFRSI
jgi:hypothetical protein